MKDSQLWVIAASILLAATQGTCALMQTFAAEQAEVRMADAELLRIQSMNACAVVAQNYAEALAASREDP